MPNYESDPRYIELIKLENWAELLKYIEFKEAHPDIKQRVSGWYIYYWKEWLRKKIAGSKNS